MNFTDFAIDKILYKRFFSSESLERVLIRGGNGTQLSTDEKIIFSFIPQINGSLGVVAYFTGEEVRDVFKVIVYCGDEKQNTFSNDVKTSIVKDTFTVNAYNKYTIAVQASRDTGTLPTVSEVFIGGGIADNVNKYIKKV